MKKKSLCLLLVFAMSLGLALPAGADDVVNFPDVENHWAKSSVDRWAGYGVLKGASGGNFKPDDGITRGDLALMLYRMMGYSRPTGENPFSDLARDAYYADAVLALNHADILKGDKCKVRPADKITREETAVLLARVLGLSDSSISAGFGDQEKIPSWAVGAVNAMAGKGYFLGGDDGTFGLGSYVTRAEVATLLDRMFSIYVNASGTYSGFTEGNVLVTAADTVLKDMKIGGSVIIAEGVGLGNMTLEAVTVADHLLVRGGGANSVYIKGGSSVANVVVARRDRAVRVVVEDGSNVTDVRMENGSSNVKLEGTVERVTVFSPRIEVEITGKVLTAQLMEAAVASLFTIREGATLETVTTEAPESKIIVNGVAVTAGITTTALGASVIVEKEGNVPTVVVAGAGATVSGSGKVGQVLAKADNVSVTTGGTKVMADPGVSGTTAGGKTVAGGSSTTTPVGGGGSSGSGGGGGTTSSYTVTLSGQKNGEAKYDITDSGYSDSALFYEGVIEKLYRAKEIQVVNGLDLALRQIQTAGWASGTVGEKLTLTASGKQILSQLSAKHTALKNLLTSAAEIDHTGDSETSLAKLLDALNPATLVESDKFQTSKEYYTTLQTRMGDIFTGIQGISPASGKKEEDLVSYLAKQFMKGMDRMGLKVGVGKNFGTTAPMTEQNMKDMLKALRTDSITLAGWLSACGVTELTMSCELNGTMDGISIPTPMQGTYTFRFKLTK